MKSLSLSLVLLAWLVAPACSPGPASVDNHEHYTETSRFTDPGELSPMLEELPDDAVGIAEVAQRQTIHHNLLSYHGIPAEARDSMSRVWPPRMPDLLAALEDSEPHNLSGDRELEQRIIGACMSESHFLAGMLRYRNIPVRVRAGYFQNVRDNPEHIVGFWENLLRDRGTNAELLSEDPERWREEINAYTSGKNEIDHRIEHWIAEYWDADDQRWRLLDANTTYLKAHSDMDVDFHLLPANFEYAWSAWKRMRTEEGFDPDQYEEEPQDGRSHIRSQLVWDFFSLLNHDIAGYGEPSREAFLFVKGTEYDSLTPLELEELDALADLVSRDPTRDELVRFYHESSTLGLVSAEEDPYSFVYRYRD